MSVYFFNDERDDCDATETRDVREALEPDDPGLESGLVVTRAEPVLEARPDSDAATKR